MASGAKKKSSSTTKARKPGAAKVKSTKAALRKCEAEDFVCGWEFESLARAEGWTRIAGVDEVGRGPLFGPVVAAAVILPHDAELDGLNDSKKLTQEERERFDSLVREVALAWAIAEVDAATIDRINILQASRLAMRLAVSRLTHPPDCLLIDGNQKIDWGCMQRTVVKGDARSLSIAAASVIAKVHRDRLLSDFDLRYPGYGLARNMGYPTIEHRAALLRLGATEMHRRSFRGVCEAEAELEFELSLEFEELPEDL
jgi:ribonuclease HII